MAAVTQPPGIASRAAVRAQERPKRGLAEYVQELVGDVGALVKLTMAKKQYRTADDIDRRIAHEVVNCFWSVLIIADELGLDLEPEFAIEMTKLEQRIGPVHTDDGNR